MTDVLFEDTTKTHFSTCSLGEGIQTNFKNKKSKGHNFDKNQWKMLIIFTTRLGTYHSYNVEIVPVVSVE